jgi:hypothetical protein
VASAPVTAALVAVILASRSDRCAFKFAKRLTETTDPVVVAVFRLTISETVHAPKVAQARDPIARRPTRD